MKLTHNQKSLIRSINRYIEKYGSITIKVLIEGFGFAHYTNDRGQVRYPTLDGRSFNALLRAGILREGVLKEPLDIP